MPVSVMLVSATHPPPAPADPTPSGPVRPAPVRFGDAGQSTVEYALVILAAAALALLVLAWAARTGSIESLFDKVVESVTSKVT